MKNIIKINAETMTVSARELHSQLNISTPFTMWFERMCAYGFSEGVEFFTKMLETSEKGGRPAKDYDITVDMAKEICMIQRTPEGKVVRQYLIDLEKAWNTPELVMARGLKAAQKMIEQKDSIIKELSSENERMKPKEIFADAVTSSDSSILIRDFAKMMRQNGVHIGEKRLYKWLRENGYICQKSTEPTQRAMEMGLFERIIRTIQKGDGLPLETQTTKITGKGQVYFTNKLIPADKEESKKEEENT
jgi:anti-repressor protein